MARNPISLLMVLLGLGLCSLYSVAQEEPAIDLRDVQRRLRDVRSYLRQEVLNRTSSPLSPHGLVAEVGKDPELLRAWVEQNIAFEPYLGAVRGVEGTLAAGAGNDWDRALLLGTLCGAAGQRFRYLPVERSEAEIDAIMAALGTVPEELHTPDETPFEVDEVLARFGVDAASQRAELLAARANRQRVLDEAFDAAALELPALEAALQASTEPRHDFEAWQQHLRAALGTRVLVRLEAAPEAPLALGPDEALPDAERLAATKAVLYPPPGQRSELRIRVVLTATGADAPEQPTVLLERSFKPEELISDPLRLEVVPTRGRVTGAPQEWSPDEFYHTIAGFETFRVVLRHGNRQYKSRLEFDKAGRSFVFKSGPAAAQLGGGLGGMNLGGALTGDEQGATPQDIQLEALTLELEWKLPGQELVRRERLIYGRLRQDVSPVFVTDILVAPGPIREEVAAWLKLEAVEGIAGLYDRLANAHKDPMRYVNNAAVVKMMPELLHDWQRLRRGLLADYLSGQPELGLLSGPLILQKCKWAVPHAEERTIGRRDVLDVVYDGTLCYPRTAEATEAAFRANLFLGIGSTVLESLLVRDTAPWMGTVRGAHARFEAARAAGHSATLAAPEGLAGLPALSAWGIARNETGRAQVFPQAEGAGDWWSVDLRTGSTIGRGSGGEGQSMTEYIDIHQWQLQTITCFKGFVMANLAPGTVSEGSDPVQDWILCTLGFSATTPTSTYANLDGGQAAGRWAGMFSIVWSLIGVAQQYQEFE